MHFYTDTIVCGTASHTGSATPGIAFPAGPDVYKLCTAVASLPRPL